MPQARGFAREYYAMALLFDPENKEARERSGLTPAMLADFQDRAARGEFTEAELSAARWLDVLAEEDKTIAAQKADELLAFEMDSANDERSAGSVLVQSRALDAARGAGIVVTAPAAPEPEPEVVEDEGETEGEPELIDEGETEGDEVTTGPVKTGGKRRSASPRPTRIPTRSWAATPAIPRRPPSWPSKA